MVLCPFVLCKEGVGTACDHVESKRRIAAGILSLGTCFASGCLIKLAMSGHEVYSYVQQNRPSRAEIIQAYGQSLRMCRLKRGMTMEVRQPRAKLSDEHRATLHAYLIPATLGLRELVKFPYELIGLAYDGMTRHHVHVTYDTSMAMLFLVSAARNYHRSASRGQDFNEL